MMRLAVAIVVLSGGASAAEKIINVVIKSSMSDTRPLFYARGSSSCWGIPGLAPQPDGSINVVPDETNHACTCGDSSCDYYEHLFMPLYLDAKWDILHKFEELIGQIKFAGEAKKNSSGAEQWEYKCEVTDAEAKYNISCNEVTSPDPSLYFKAFEVSLSDPSATVASKKSQAKSMENIKPAQRFAVSANSSVSTCDCFNSCLSKTWEECCQCNDCANDPAVKPHCTNIAVAPVISDPCLTFNSTYFSVIDSTSALFHKQDIFKLDGSVDSTHRDVKATSVIGTSPDHTITFGKLQPSGGNVREWQLTVGVEGQQFTGECAYYNFTSEPARVSLAYSSSGSRVSLALAEDFCDDLDQKTCGNISACSWCVSKDKLHELCFQQNGLPDPTTWDCGGTNFAMVV